MEKIDLFKQFKDEYKAGETPSIVTVAPARFLSVSGRGAPGGDIFVKKLGALYAVAHAIKSTRKAAGQDYVISKLQGLWWGDFGYESFLGLPQDTWNWTFLVRTPEFVQPADIRAAAKALLAKGKAQEVAEVAPFSLDEGRCVQALHVGPYQDEYKTLARMRAFIDEQGGQTHGLHHEIYLSDPRRTAPEKLKTILRQPVRTAS